MNVDSLPAAYRAGRATFAGLSLTVDERVLVPRRETELLVEIACQQPDNARVHEIGTGSGAIALAIKDIRPDLIVTASDVSQDALTVARQNRDELGLDVPIFEGFLMELREIDLEEIDLVVANLPYLTKESAASRPATLEAEPDIAIYDQDDGLGLIRLLIEESNNGQMVALEHDTHHGPKVRDMLRYGVTLRDHQDDERVTVGQVWNG